MARVVYADPDFDILVGTPPDVGLTPTSQYGVNATVVANALGTARFGATAAFNRLPGHGRGSWESHLSGGLSVGATAYAQLVSLTNPLPLSDGVTVRWWMRVPLSGTFNDVVVMQMVLNSMTVFVNLNNNVLSLSATPLPGALADAIRPNEWFGVEVSVQQSPTLGTVVTMTTLSPVQGRRVLSAQLGVFVVNTLNQLNFGFVDIDPISTVDGSVYWDDLIVDSEGTVIPFGNHLELLVPDTTLTNNWLNLVAAPPGSLKDGNPGTGVRSGGGLLAPARTGRWDFTNPIADDPATSVEACNLNVQLLSVSALPVNTRYRDQATGLSAGVGIPLGLGLVKVLNAFFLTQTLQAPPAPLNVSYVEGPLSFELQRDTLVVTDDAQVYELWGYAEIIGPAGATTVGAGGGQVQATVRQEATALLTSGVGGGAGVAASAVRINVPAAAAAGGGAVLAEGTSLTPIILTRTGGGGQGFSTVRAEGDREAHAAGGGAIGTVASKVQEVQGVLAVGGGSVGVRVLKVIDRQDAVVVGGGQGIGAFPGEGPSVRRCPTPVGTLRDCETDEGSPRRC